MLFFYGWVFICCSVHWNRIIQKPCNLFIYERYVTSTNSIENREKNGFENIFPQQIKSEPQEKYEK